MNTTSYITLKPIMIFAIVAGLVVMAMLMGRKNGHRAGMGWWIGLGLLLFIVSLFFGIFSWRSSVTEERYSERSAFRNVMSDMKESLESVRESIQEGVDEVRQGVNEAKQSIQRSIQTSGKRAKGGTTLTVVNNPTNTPSNTVTLQVTVKDKERSQQQEEVRKSLHSKAVRSVNRWANERLPMKQYALNLVDFNWLQEHGAFPEDVSFEPEMMPTVDPQQFDPVYGGTLKVVLLPPVQASLIELGYSKLQLQMEDDQFTTQGIICIVLLGLTGFLGLLALVKTVVNRRSLAVAS